MPKRATAAIDAADGVPTREAIWKGRPITYRPGRLHVCLGRGVAHRNAYNLLVESGCRIEYGSFNDGVFEVVVPPQETLHLAGLLGTNSFFRYVEPDVVRSDEYG